MAVNNEKGEPIWLAFFVLCTPAGARTLDTLIKSQVLYQLSYGCILFQFAGAKVGIIFKLAKFLAIFFL